MNVSLLSLWKTCIYKCTKKILLINIWIFIPLSVYMWGVEGVTIQVYRGFYTAYLNTTIRLAILDVVEREKKFYGDIEIIAIEHSMGGAMASFCGLDLMVIIILAILAWQALYNKVLCSQSPFNFFTQVLSMFCQRQGLRISYGSIIFGKCLYFNYSISG